METELRDLLIRLDEKVKALGDKLDAFTVSTKENYVCKSQFERWQNDEFSPIEEKVIFVHKWFWLVITVSTGSILAYVYGIIFK